MAFTLKPEIKIQGKAGAIHKGWDEALERIEKIMKENNINKIAFETYPGTDEQRLLGEIKKKIHGYAVVPASRFYKSEGEIDEMIAPYLTEDPVFGKLSYLEIKDFFDERKMVDTLTNCFNEKVIAVGTGASLLFSNPFVIYGDITRWEIQLRFRKNEAANLGADNQDETAALQYKRAFFIDWRAADRLKKKLLPSFDYYLDLTCEDTPKLVRGDHYRDMLRETAKRPFELVPYFDPGPWGGRWMNKVCGLPDGPDNYAWCFNCVPEENSLLFEYKGVRFESPAINLVFFQSGKLLGEKVYARFGAEFPIRFDFLDTMGGGNLSLQVHPSTDYIQEKFGWHYTQDESYYLMDKGEKSKVYLGLKEKVKGEEMIDALQKAQDDKTPFPAEKYAETWEVKKHDHVLIPAGTVHCSGSNCMVLEISSTPYIFTFKLWDWGRLGLDGKPRPINIHRGSEVIQWGRTKKWTEKNLVNRVEKVAEGDGWVEEKTGLHELEFIETRRHWFYKKVSHYANGSVQVLNLVEGEQVLVESPKGEFEPMLVNYAETFVVPASVESYTIRPHGPGKNKKHATIKAYVRV